MGRLQRLTGRRPVVGGLLLTTAIALLAGTTGLGLVMLRQTQTLSENVRFTQDIVDANVRTLSQVQRELLRLEVLLRQPRPDGEAVALQRALAAQRVQEGALSYQRQTLGDPALLQESRMLARSWHRRTDPLVRRVAHGAATDTQRRRAVTQVADLELAYNQLVSDGEINRKSRAGQANAATKDLLHRATLLLFGLAVTFSAFIIFLLVGGLVFVRFHRQREQTAQDLMALNVELRRHAHVVASTDNLVVLTDATGHVEWVNDAFIRTTGYALDDVIGRRPGDVLQGPRTDPETVALMSDHIAGGEGFTVEVVNYARDGREYWVSLEVTPVHDESGQLTGFVAVETDVTERRVAEQHLLAAKEAAEEAAKDKSAFLASMSHEIRTPLNAVLGLTELLLTTDLDSVQREYAGTAHKSGRLLLALINDILDFSALESGRVDPELRPFRLRDLARDSISMFEADAAHRGVDLRCEVDESLPAVVRGDDTRLRQVLVNLLANGLKFTEHGSVTLRISSGGPVIGDRHAVRLEVSDTGIGIARERRHRLFQPFSQADPSTTRKYGGTGLGLAICALVVERLGGSIRVDSRLGVGSTFTVDLALPVAASTDLQSDDAVETPTPTSSSGLRVLLAEDDAVNRLVAVHMLRRLGIEAVTASDGTAAVRAATEQPFDLVLMDVHMPSMDGVEATTRIRALLGEDAPRIVAVTANALEGDRERLMAAGMDEYLSKPVQIADLATVVRTTTPRGEARGARSDDQAGRPSVSAGRAG